MALYKLSKPKLFHVQYCGCTAASSLLNEETIRNAIHSIRQLKSKHEFVKTTVSVATDGIQIIYKDSQRFSTHVPSTMIAGSTIGKPPLHDTVGVVYISPSTGGHYPAFIHVYRCETSRSAQKLLSRLRAYILVESHHRRLVRVEQDLLARNLLNLDSFHASLSHSSNGHLSNPGASSSSTASSSNQDDSRQEKTFDPLKSITEEFQKKINSNEPLLYPPKDYDTLHVAHGDVRRAQAWKSTEPAIVGYSSMNADESRTRSQVHANPSSSKQTTETVTTNGKSRLTTQRSDTSADPVETVNLAFDFLKDETSSIFTENDSAIEPLPVRKPNEKPIYRFRPPQMNVTPKNWSGQHHEYRSTSHIPQSHPPSKNESNSFFQAKPQQMQNDYRARSETHLNYDPAPEVHSNSRYEPRLTNGYGAPMLTNPLWPGQSSNMAGSQPNLFSPQTPMHAKAFHPSLSPPALHPLYGSYPNDKPMMVRPQQVKRPVAAAPQASRTNEQYRDNQEFILRASHDRPSRHVPSSGSHMLGVSNDYRPYPMNFNDNRNPMLDVYY